MKIVFFGDSVTDAGRNFGDPKSLGEGYVKMIAERLPALYPGRELEILNRGVGGDRTEQLLARIEPDVIIEQPDIIVLEVGINDVWHRFLIGVVVSEEQFRDNYETLVTQLKGTGAKIIILQPYALRVENEELLRPYLDSFNLILGEIAAREQLPVIALDEIFRTAAREADPALFASDGIHPTPHGCSCIADLVIEELKKYL